MELNILSNKIVFLFKTQTIKLFNNFLLVLLLCLSLTSCEQPKYPLIKGPPLIIPDPNGWVLVNFWAPWCEPCLKEIPQINLLAKQLPKPLAAVVGVYFDPISDTQLASEITKYNIQFKTLTKSSGKLPVPLPQMLPANYLVSPEGQIHGPLLGPQSYDSILEAISTYTQKLN